MQDIRVTMCKVKKKTPRSGCFFTYVISAFSENHKENVDSMFHCHKNITGKIIYLVMSFLCIWKLFLYRALQYFFFLFLNLSLMI